jgi:hypothetical protein
MSEPVRSATRGGTRFVVWILTVLAVVVALPVLAFGRTTRR